MIYKKARIITLRDALLYNNELFMRKFPNRSYYRYCYEREEVLNIPNQFIMWWLDENEFVNSTPWRDVYCLVNKRKMYELCSAEYGRYNSTVVLEIKSRRCLPEDKYSRKIYNQPEWRQYGYVVWREHEDGDRYIKEYKTHYEHKICEYMLSCNLKKYAVD